MKGKWDWLTHIVLFLVALVFGMIDAYTNNNYWAFAWGVIAGLWLSDMLVYAIRRWVRKLEVPLNEKTQKILDEHSKLR